jgi:hypothetical protein
MEEEAAYHFIFAILVVLLTFVYLYPGAGFVSVLLFLTALLAVAYVIKGFIVASFGGEYTTFWTGCAIMLILVIFFNYAGVLEKIFGAIFGFLKGFAGAVFATF